MKITIFACLLIGFSFVDAGLLDTLKGGAELLPYLNDATKGFKSMASSKNKIAEALNQTDNRGESGSTDLLKEVANRNLEAGQTLSALARNLANLTDENGQLKLSTGDLTQVTNQLENIVKTFNALGEIENKLANKIDSVGLDTESMNKIKEGLNAVMEGSEEFHEAFTNISGVSKLLRQLVSIKGLSDFTDSVGELVEGYKAQREAMTAAEKRCGIETGIPEIIGKVENITNTVYENLVEVLGI